MNGKLDNLRRLEAKKSELELAEEKLLMGAASRKRFSPTSSETPPPPLPPVPPPDTTPSGAQRLDALIGAAPTKSNGIHPTASKKVSFAASEPEVNTSSEDVLSSPDNEEKLSRLERYERDPNVSQILVQ